MSMFRTLRHDLFRSLSMVRLPRNNLVHFSFHESWKLAAFCSHLFGKRTHASYNSLANDKKFLSGYEQVPELESADENVHRIFSLANASQQEKRKVLSKELMKSCNTPTERKIAKETISIANLEDHLERMRNKDKHNKVYLKWLRDQRMKKLKGIKTCNFQRYIQLIKDLNIEPLPSTHGKYAKYKFRRFKIGVEIKEKKSPAVRKTPPLTKKSDT